MINENIKNARKAKGLSQEEMAVKLNVVRQTVSKWENGLSVPDADVLIRMAELLDVSVSELLGTEAESSAEQSLSEELERLNEQLAAKNQREKRIGQAGRKMGLILFLSFAALLIALAVKQEAVSIVLTGACMLAAVIMLYRNLALLTSITTDEWNMNALRAATIFNLMMLAAGILFTVLSAVGISPFSERSEKGSAVAVIFCVMVFAGIISPKLPYNRHTGLRLPWTVRDEDTWDLAHRILGYTSLPVALLYVACALTISNLEAVTLCAMAVWLGVPGAISYLFFRKKMRGTQSF